MCQIDVSPKHSFPAQIYIYIYNDRETNGCNNDSWPSCIRMHTPGKESAMNKSGGVFTKRNPSARLLVGLLARVSPNSS